MHNMPPLMHDLPLSSARLRLAGRVEIVQGRDVQLHQHPFVELVYYLEGEVCCRVGAETLPCSTGRLRVMPPGVTHGELSLTDWACYFIWIDGSSDHPWPALYVDDAHATLCGICRTLVGEWNGQAADRGEMLSLLLQQLDLLLRRAHEQRSISASERLIRAAEHLLNERFASPLTTSTIAAELGVSPSYLREQFVRLRGQTLAAQLQELRVQHALALIRNSNFNLEAIAKWCGYDSASHLSRRIKQHTGQRPGAFREG